MLASRKGMINIATLLLKHRARVDAAQEVHV